MNNSISYNGIPKIIHHIWIQGYENMDETDKNNVQNIKRLNPDWVHVLWNDDKIRLLLESKYPDILEFYDNVVNLPGSINYLASKSDIARFVIMYEYGGCYMDVDVECVDNLNSIVKNIPKTKEIFACAMKYNMCGSQFFIASPRNKILRDVVYNITNKKDKGKLGGAMSDTIINKYMDDIYVLNDVSMYHCGTSYKCMIPIHINSNDHPLHPRRCAKYICDNRPQFMIAGTIIIILLIVFISVLLLIRK